MDAKKNAMNNGRRSGPDKKPISYKICLGVPEGKCVSSKVMADRVQLSTPTPNVYKVTNRKFFMIYLS